MQTNLNHYSHKVGANYWHMDWSPKYRYKMMRKPENKNLVAAAIRKAAYEHGIVIHELSVMPDHVHVVDTLPRGMTDSKAMQLLKGRSSYIIFRNQEKFRLRYPQGHFWSPGGTAVTVGPNDLATVIEYVRNQEQHHNITSL